MPISINQAQAGVSQFLDDYPSAANGDIQFHFVDTLEELYGKEKAGFIPKNTKGAFHPKGGFVALICSNIHNDGDLRETIQHEVLGHHGTLTFETGQKKALLTAIRGSRNSADMQEDWKYIDRVYSGYSESMKCEEMFCLHAERIQGKPLHDLKGVNQTFGEVVMGGRTMNQADLQTLVHGVADGMARGTRVKKIFPEHDHDQYRLSNVLEPARDEAVALLGPRAKAHPAQNADGVYKGPIVGATTNHLLQKVSETQVVAHDKNLFVKSPEINANKSLQVKYQNGKANYQQNRSINQEREQGRGR